MSHRRHLVSRSRNNEAQSPAARSHHREAETPGTRRPLALPSYEALSCPLSAAAKLKLEQLRSNMGHEYSKYGKHRKASTSAIAEAITDANERLAYRKDKVRKTAERRRERNIEDASRSEGDLEAESYAKDLEKRVTELTAVAEKATMDLIDYGDELSMQEEFMKEVLEKSTIAGEAPADNPEILSPWEILQSAKEEYTSQYTQRSMRDRYADHNDYKGFKRLIHEAQHSGTDNIPPLPHPKTWRFPDENDNTNRRRRNNASDNTENADDEEEIVISGVKDTLKCPITLQWIKEPYSNKVCNHSFEKEAILDLHKTTATVFYKNLPGNQRVQDGPKRSQCPVPGCEKWHILSDFFYDPAIKRRVMQAQKREQRQADGVDDDDDDDNDDDAPRGTQARRPEQIDDDDDEDDDGIEIDDSERRKEIAKIKRERARSRGLSTAPTQDSPDDNDPMDID